MLLIAIGAGVLAIVAIVAWRRRPAVRIHVGKVSDGWHRERLINHRRGE